MRSLAISIPILLVLLMTPASPAHAQPGSQAPSGTQQITPDQLDTLLAPIALYPDALVTAARDDDTAELEALLGPDGTIFESDLGDDTASITRGITTFNPDGSWYPVE